MKHTGQIDANFEWIENIRNIARLTIIFPKFEIHLIEHMFIFFSNEFLFGVNDVIVTIIKINLFIVWKTDS